LDTSINNPRFSDNGIFWAITGSVLLHTLIAVAVPNFNFSDVIKKPQVLKIELQKPAPPAPVIEPLPPIDIPEPPKPQPIKKVKPKKKKPIIKPKPIKKEAPAPVVEPIEEVTPPPVTEEVIAVQPTAEVTPEATVPTPPPAPVEPPPPPQPSQADKDNAKSAYRSQLGRAFDKYKSYPRVAQRRGQQGTVIVTIKIDSNGNVVSAVVSKSSGYSSLDKDALKAVKKASPLPRPPSALNGVSFTITVPRVYKLKTN